MTVKTVKTAVPVTLEEIPDRLCFRLGAEDQDLRRRLKTAKNHTKLGWGRLIKKALLAGLAEFAGKEGSHA